MNFDDRKAFAAALAQMFCVYAVPVTPLLIDAFWTTLEIYSIQNITAAFTLHVRDPQWGHRAPTPADIIKHLTVTMPDLVRQHCEQILAGARTRLALLHEEAAQLSNDIKIGAVTGLAANESRDRVLQLVDKMTAINAEPQIIAARQALAKQPQKYDQLPPVIASAVRRIAHG